MKPADLVLHCFLKRLYLGSAGQVLNKEKYWLGLRLYALAVMVNMIKFTAVMSKFTANFTQTYSPSSS